MSTLDVRTTGTPDTAGRPSGPVPGTPAEPDDYSPAFSAFALLLATGVLAGLVLAVWAMGR